MEEKLQFDVLFIGAGPANMASALHLMNLVENYNKNCEKNGRNRLEPSVAIIEKGSQLGAHSLSGAIMKPQALKELIPDYLSKNPPIEGRVKYNDLYHLSKTNYKKIPGVSFAFNNKGNLIVSLAKLVRWLGDMLDEKGVDIFPEFSATKIIFEGQKILGVKLGDKGINKHGLKGVNYLPGMEIESKVTVFGEGSKGVLLKQLDEKFQIFDPCYPPVFEVGIKEIFKVPKSNVDQGRVIHLVGYPLNQNRDGEKKDGGAFIYNLSENLVALGMVVALNTEDPLFDPHAELQRIKRHPFVNSLLSNGTPQHYGCKTLACGGFYTTPKIYFHGGLVVGDSASFVNTFELKGIHLAMKSGMLAAETILEALIKGNFSKKQLKNYSLKVGKSYIFDELYRHRNLKQTLKDLSVKKIFLQGLQSLSGSLKLNKHFHFKADHKHTRSTKDLYKNPHYKKYCEIKYDGKYYLDKLSDVYNANLSQIEDQQVHLKIKNMSLCKNECLEKFRRPCTHFCPAKVYQVGEGHEMLLDSTNCLHCKSCEIKCPFQNVDFTLPEGGSGPNYVIG